ncbi:MAG: FliM/FliN family flagellar motor switch protein, partial [Gemmatimonadales bacterium]|nr:FliM/FliN family flagellar motor switch protein [Gemmatimonadales bacterium]
RIEREITDIERSILDGVIRIMLRDLREAWRQVAAIDFTVEAYETEPQLLQILAPNEAVVAISMEIRIGEVSGMINLAVPSITLKMLAQRFDQQWTSRKSEATDADHSRVLHLIRNAKIRIDTRLRGPTLSVEDLLRIEPGDVLTFDFPVSRPIDVTINGRLKYKGQIVASGRKRSVELGDQILATD